FAFVFLQQVAERAGSRRLGNFARYLRRIVARRGLTGVAPADFAHLVAGLHQAVVKPVFGLRLAVAALALGNFVLVVWKDQVEAPTVDVEGLAQQAAAHGRAFDMPAGASLAPGAVPGGLARLGVLPEGKIGYGPLALGRLSPFALEGRHIA